MELAKKVRRRFDHLARPFVSALELDGANAHGTFPKAPFIARKLVFGVPLVGRAAGDERRRHPLQCAGREFRRNIAANRNDACDSARRIHLPRERP